MNSKIKVGVVGATGYTGVELLRLLSSHPNIEITTVTSRSESGKAVSDYFPSLRGIYDLTFQTPEHAGLEKCDIVFFATPNGIAMNDAPRLWKKVSASSTYPLTFVYRIFPHGNIGTKLKHASPDIVPQAVYGLSELNRDAIASAQIVANPGCYPTCVSLPLLPLLKEGRLKPHMPLIADCKSGVSGAGRKANTGSLLCRSRR